MRYVSLTYNKISILWLFEDQVSFNKYPTTWGIQNRYFCFLITMLADHLGEVTLILSNDI